MKNTTSVSKQVVSGMVYALLIILGLISIGALSISVLATNSIRTQTYDLGADSNSLDGLIISIEFLILSFTTLIGLVTSIVGWLVSRKWVPRTSKLFIGLGCLCAATVVVAYLIFALKN